MKNIPNSMQRIQLTKAILNITAKYDTPPENEVDFSTARPKRPHMANEI